MKKVILFQLLMHIAISQIITNSTNTENDLSTEGKIALIIGLCVGFLLFVLFFWLITDSWFGFSNMNR